MFCWVLLFFFKEIVIEGEKRPESCKVVQAKQASKNKNTWNYTYDSFQFLT